MKNIKTYNLFNESLKNKLKGKSEKEIQNNISGLSWDDKLINFVKFGYLDMLKDIIENVNGELDQDEINSLMGIAVFNNQIEILKYLHSIGGDLEYDKQYLLNVASRYGYLDIVKYLIDNGLDHKKWDYEAFELAVYGNNKDIVKYYLDLGIDEDVLKKSYLVNRIKTKEVYNDMVKLIEDYIKI